MRFFSKPLIVLASVLFASASDSAHSGGELKLDWSTFGSGGGTSDGGSFVLNGTLAQLSADPLAPASGGEFAISGGFWVQSVTTPTDVIFRDGFESR